MLIDLVKDSVLRCFCHTCSANTAITELQINKKPFGKKNKTPKHKQPKRKRRYHATEIRCEEKSRGGMCYEVILAAPIADKPRHKDASPGKSITSEGISLKLKQAEERRKSVESSKVASINEMLTRLEEASRKREEFNAAFIACTQLTLEEKLESSSFNREEHLNSLKLKLAEHQENIVQVREQMEKQSMELNEAIYQKMTTVKENRDENMRRILEKLKDHDERAQNVRLVHEDTVKQIKRKIQAKLTSAETNRKIEKYKKLVILKECERRRELVRFNKMKIETQTE